MKAIQVSSRFTRGSTIGQDRQYWADSRRLPSMLLSERRMIPEALFRFISSFNLKDSLMNCDFHEFISSSLKPKSTSTPSLPAPSAAELQQTCRFTCKKCFMKLVWERVRDGQKACKSCHFALVKKEEGVPSGNRGIRLQIECDYCQIGWSATFSPRLLDGESLNNFLNFNKDEGGRATALFMLEFYTANIYHGSPKPINSENPKFKQFIGINETSLKIISLIGYTLVGSHFQPTGELAENTQIEILLSELSLYRYIRSQGTFTTDLLL